MSLVNQLSVEAVHLHSGQQLNQEQLMIELQVQERIFILNQEEQVELIMTLVECLQNQHHITVMAQ